MTRMCVNCATLSCAAGEPEDSGPTVVIRVSEFCSRIAVD